MSAPSRLIPILRDVRRRAAERRAQRSLADLRASVPSVPERRAQFVAALRRPGLAFITEIKRRSPSAGVLAVDVDPAERAQAYAVGGAAALSILTEADHFHGSPEDLALVAGSGLPRLRKDFIVDEGMLLESVEMGADAVLLLACCLDGSLLQELREVADKVGLAVLCEVHDAAELERALAIKPDCVGVNARDLTSFEVDLATVEALLPQVPAAFVKVAESGIRGLDELARVQRAGADAALVGESLMRTPDPARLLESWRAALHV